MGVFVRRDSPFYQLWLEGYGKEPTKLRVDAPTAARRRENKLLAEQRYHQRMTELARDQIAPERPAIRFDAYADWYEVHLTAHKRGRERELEILAHLRKAFAGYALGDVTVDAVLEWKTRRLQTVAASTWNRELDVLKHMLARAVPKYLAVSPLARMHRQRTVRQALRILSPEDEAKLLAVLTPADRALVIAALDTLMRLGDLLRLKRSDDHRRYLTILNPKTSEPYEVPVSSRLRVALDALPTTTHEYLFWRRRTAIVPRYAVKLMLQRACAKAGIAYGRGRGITFHALRHTGASRMVERGIDLRTVQEIGGWSSLRQLSRYAHPTDDAKRRAVEAVSGSLTGVPIVKTRPTANKPERSAVTRSRGSSSGNRKKQA